MDPVAVPSLLDPLALVTPARALPLFSRDAISFLVGQGHLLVLHRQLVYRLNGWVTGQTHPGGSLPILHFVGRDATDELESFHGVAAMQRMRAFVVARVDSRDWPEATGWKPLTPPLHLGWPQNYAHLVKGTTLQDSLLLWKAYQEEGFPTSGSPGNSGLPFLSTSQLEPPPPPAGIDPAKQRRLALSFRQLRSRLLATEGLFEMDPLKNYRYTILRCGALFIGFLALYFLGTSKLHLAVSAVCLGLFKHQTMFVAHDAGHTEITGDFFFDRTIGSLIAAFESGISLSWWTSQHDVHHVLPNHPEHDPDIQLLAVFAFSPDFFHNVYSTFHEMVMPFDFVARSFVSYQHLVFYPMMVVARFSLFGKSYYHLLMKAKADSYRTFEIVGVLFFWTWFTCLIKGIRGVDSFDTCMTRIGYCLLVLLVVSPIHVQIVLSHSAQDNIDAGLYECFVHRQLRTTMDVACPAYLDFVHGGLQMQIAHHLFPRLPRAQLRKATVAIKEWCIENEVEFNEKSFTEGNEQMYGMLSDIAGQCRALMHTADKQAKGDGFAL